MKPAFRLKLLFTFLLSIGIAVSAFSQALKETFTKSDAPITYLGIDFSKSRLLDIGNANDIRDRLYASINQLIVTEPKKFDLAAAFRKNGLEHDFSAVTKVNSAVNLNDIISSNSSDFNRLKEADIAASVKALDLAGKKGIGLVFVMEAMRKVEKKGDIAVWVTLVDMEKKKVLMTERVEAKATAGIGFRNYWASAIKIMIDQIEKDKYKEWQKKYGN